MIDRRGLDELTRLAQYFEERKERAVARLAADVAPAWHFAILGLALDAAEFEFESVGRLRSVEEPPGEIELAAATVQPNLFGAVGRYSRSVRYELSIPTGDEEQLPFTLAWWIISLIRVRTGAEILVPAVADHSWSVIAGCPPKTCQVQLLEDVPDARPVATAVPVSLADLEWVEANLVQFAQLLAQPDFRFAVECMSTHRLERDARMMAVMLWAGIEGIFGVREELRFRLAALIATALEDPGPNRLAVYRRAKKLYDTRSTAVHGGQVESESLFKHVLEVRQLLSRLLCQFIDMRRVPSVGDLEQALFAGKEGGDL